MSLIREEAIDKRSDEDLFSLLGHELEARITTKRGTPEFVAEIKELPFGLRAMAATFDLDVSLALDDLGWHFGNWHHVELAHETISGLHELGADRMAEIFGGALEHAQCYWTELGSENWLEWYPGSLLETAVASLTN